MFVCSGMEHHLRMIHFKHFPHTDGIFHVGDDKSHLVALVLEILRVVHLELEIIHRRLGLVEHDEFGRVVVHHLTANLASDRSGSTRDKHHFFVDFTNDIALTQDDGLTTQKILNLDVLDLVGFQLSIHPFVECGNRFHNEVESHTLLDDLFSTLFTYARNGQNHHVNIEFLHEFRRHSNLGRVNFYGINLCSNTLGVIIDKGFDFEF